MLGVVLCTGIMHSILIKGLKVSSFLFRGVPLGVPPCDI